MANYYRGTGRNVSSISLNGRHIQMIDDDVYVDGVLYLPADEVNDNQSRSPQRKSNEPIEYEFPIYDSFTSIRTSIPMDLVYRQTDNIGDDKVFGTLPEDLIEKIDVSVSNGRLWIVEKPQGLSFSYLSNGMKPKLYVVSNKLASVSVQGSGDFTIQGDVNCAEAGLDIMMSGSGSFCSEGIFAGDRDVSISVSGSGGVSMGRITAKDLFIYLSGSADITCEKVDTRKSAIYIKGSGDVQIAGTTERIDFSIMGSGDINASALMASAGMAMISGSGDIDCNVENLSTYVRGSGDVNNRRV